MEACNYPAFSAADTHLSKTSQHAELILPLPAVRRGLQQRGPVEAGGPPLSFPGPIEFDDAGGGR